MHALTNEQPGPSAADLDDLNKPVPEAVVLVAVGEDGKKFLYMHPYQQPARDKALSSSYVPEGLPVDSLHKTSVGGCGGGGGGGVGGVSSPAGRAAPTGGHHSNTGDTVVKHTAATQFGVSTGMMAELFSVKDSACDTFEMKIDTVRFAGYFKKISGCQETINVVWVLPSWVDAHVVQSFQTLSRKLVLAIDSMQSLNGYFQEQYSILQRVSEDAFAKPEAERPENPWWKAREKSKLAALLAQVHDDVRKTGVVQVFVDDFIEVGFCVESRALSHAHLPPRSRDDIDRLVRRIRPYHGLLLLENISPSPDANPSVALLLQHCQPDRSILTISTASGIPLLQVLVIVRHLLLWARAIVIYPLCNTNVYTSATSPRPLDKQIELFRRQFGGAIHLAAALAHFNPPCALDSFVLPKLSLAEQQLRTRVVCSLLRHQLIMQLHRFCYVLPPLSTATLPRSGRHCPEAMRAMIEASPLPPSIRTIVSDICGKMLEAESYSVVEKRLALLIRMAPLLNGEHHVEDLMYRLNQPRAVLDDVIKGFDVVLCSFYRPDFIAEI